MTQLITVGTGSTGNAYILRDGDRQMLLDAGVYWKNIQKASGYAPIDLAVISHWHSDHVEAVKMVSRYACDVYAGEDAAQGIAERTGGKVRPLKPQKVYHINDWTVLCFPLPHEDVPNYGFIIRSPVSYHTLAYLTDFGYTKYRFRRIPVETLLISCNHVDDTGRFKDAENFQHVLRGHSSLSVVKEIIKTNMTDALKHIILCHMSEDNADPEDMQREIQELVGNEVSVDIAEKGKVIDL